jgi:hypothetical protein|tara:strand:+ start:803 stop:1057 length:255 start_codon:yes stop_codon:yes gene_type:complete
MTVEKTTDAMQRHGVLLSLSIQNLDSRRITMEKVSSVLRKIFGFSSSKDNDFLVWAKTEYGKDWRFAYEHMLETRGQSPKDIGK